MTILFRNSMTARLLSGLLATVFLAAPLPAGTYTVTLTGKTPSGEWKERDPEG